MTPQAASLLEEVGTAKPAGVDGLQAVIPHLGSFNVVISIFPEYWRKQHMG
jgi:hypothetical protein